MPIEQIARSILALIGHKVVFDAELAKLYGVTNARLNQQVRRGRKRFLDRQGLKCIRVDRAKLVESWEAWIHVRVSGELDYKVPLQGPRPDTLAAVLTWPNSD